MPHSPLNRIDADPAGPSRSQDVPERVRRRYLIERGSESAVAYFTDATATKAAFRDEGRRLTTERNDPHVVADLVAVAHHRGWSVIQVRGETRFRREVWIQARALGIEVQGYRATERDLQALERHPSRDARELPPSPADPQRRRDQDRLRRRIVETVVEARVRDPQARAAILASARQRIAGWLERGATPRPAYDRDRDR